MAIEASGLPPRWVRRAFWTVVALEWSVVSLLTVVIIGFAVLAWRAFSCIPDTTVYSAGYSDQAWNAIHAGDSQVSVVLRLGRPLETWSTAGEQLWSYSKPGLESDGDYRERKLRFSRQGIVLERVDACYID